MGELFDLDEYRKYLENYYRHPIDSDTFSKRKKMIDRYSDEYLQKIIDNTEEFIIYLINRMQNENNVFEGKCYTYLEIRENNKYISNNCCGGWHADTLYSPVEFNSEFFISHYLLEKFLGSNIYVDDGVIEDDSDYSDEDFEIGSIYTISRLVISIPNEKFNEISENIIYKSINDKRVNKVNEIIKKYKVDNDFSTKEISDGHHTFGELYHHRMVLFCTICNLFPSLAWKSRKHYDEENDPMCSGSFIAGINTPDGIATYHIKLEYWDMFNIPEVDRAPKYDNEYNSDDVIKRVYSLSRK